MVEWLSNKRTKIKKYKNEDDKTRNKNKDYRSEKKIKTTEKASENFDLKGR